jgi:hypothetical protein
LKFNKKKRPEQDMFFCANFKTIYTQVKQTGILLLSHLGDKLLLKLAHTVNQDRGIN